MRFLTFRCATYRKIRSFIAFSYVTFATFDLRLGRAFLSFHEDELQGFFFLRAYHQNRKGGAYIGKTVCKVKRIIMISTKEKAFGIRHSAFRRGKLSNDHAKKNTKTL